MIIDFVCVVVSMCRIIVVKSNYRLAPIKLIISRVSSFELTIIILDTHEDAFSETSEVQLARGNFHRKTQ